MMRTTLTLDDDVAAQIEKARTESDRTFKEVVNDALRLGLRALMEPSDSDQTPYRTPSESLGGCLLGSLDDIGDALAAAEGDAFR